MFTIEFEKGSMESPHDLFNEFPECKRYEISSFGSDTIIQIVIPLVAILAPVVSPVIVKLLEDKKVSAKFDGIELSGDYHNVQKLIRDIQSFRKENRSLDITTPEN